jgi:hypothetical protein
MDPVYMAHYYAHWPKKAPVDARFQTVDADKRKTAYRRGNLPKRPKRKPTEELIVPGEVWTAEDREIADLLDMQNSDSSSMQRYLRELDPSNAGSEEEDEEKEKAPAKSSSSSKSSEESSSGSSMEESSDDDSSEHDSSDDSSSE